MKGYLFALLTALLLTNLSVVTSAQKKSSPILSGERAIEQLKQTGGLDSLREAVQEEDWAQSWKTTSFDGRAQDDFGYSVAVSGNTAAIGAPTHDVNTVENQGAVYIYVRNGATWALEAKLTASDGGFREWFGQSVALDANTLVVGAHYDTIFESQQGSAYVFVRTGTTWTEQAKLVAADYDSVDNFGVSVAVSGDTAIVGAPKDNIGTRIDQGSAYIFVRSGGAWTQQAKLAAVEGAAEFDEFGMSVDVDGDTAIVGERNDDNGVVLNHGSVHVFNRANGVWSFQQRIFAADAEDGDLFGISVAFSGGTIIAGAFGEDGNGEQYDKGAAYVFVRSGAAWIQQAKLTAIGGEAGDSFGISVAIDGNTAVVGADYDFVGSNYEQGSAYVFKRTGADWTQQKQITSATGKEGDNFGYSVGISNNLIVAGAPYVNVTGSGAFRNAETGETDAPLAGANQGAAFFFAGALAPTAANVKISGRVIAPRSLGLTNALVTLTDAQGNSQTVLTGKNGAFRFTDVAAGETYIVSVHSKRYNYLPQVITPTEDVTELVFSPQN